MNIKEIILEELNGYDFLGMSKIQEEINSTSLLKSPEFIKEFVYDSINNFDEKIKLQEKDGIDGIVNTEDNLNNDTNNFDLSFLIKILYSYKDKNVNIQLYFEGKDIPFELNDKNNREESDFSFIDWSAIDVFFQNEENETMINSKELYKLIGNQEYNDFIKTYAIKYILDKKIIY